MAESNTIKANDNHNYWLILGALGSISVIACVLAHFFAMFPGDLSLTLWVQSGANKLLTIVMKGISFIFGDTGAVLTGIILAGIVWWRIGRLEGLMIVAGGIVSLLNYAIKYAVDRPRPSSLLVQILAPEQQSSFPSGHACFTIIILGSLTYFAVHKLREPAWRILFLSGAIILTLLLGVSRVYLGDHWPSDVIGGYLVGGFFFNFANLDL